MTTSRLTFRRFPMGGFAASDGSSWDYVWTGPGSDRIYLAGVRGGALVPVEPEVYRHDGTERGARAAVRRFIADSLAEREAR